MMDNNNLQFLRIFVFKDIFLVVPFKSMLFILLYSPSKLHG